MSGTVVRLLRSAPGTQAKRPQLQLGPGSMAGILAHTVPHHRKGREPPNYVNSVTSPRARPKEQLLPQRELPCAFSPQPGAPGNLCVQRAAGGTFQVGAGGMMSAWQVGHRTWELSFPPARHPLQPFVAGFAVVAAVGVLAGHGVWGGSFCSVFSILPLPLSFVSEIPGQSTHIVSTVATIIT